MTKVLYNKQVGGFGLSERVIEYFKDNFNMNINSHGWNWCGDCYNPIERHDSRLIEAVESIGLDESSGEYSKLAFYELDGELYNVAEHEDGTEYVMTPENIRWINVNE